jgi:uncharacterized protein (TIGR00645 family)
MNRRGLELNDAENGYHKWYEEIFETILFNCRFLVMLAVIGILVAAVVMFAKGCIEIVQGVRAFWSTLLGLRPTAADDNSVILSFIPALDNYLFATILLIIAMGLYELFISKIDPGSRTASSRPDWLAIKELDDLKAHIGEVVIMILIVNFFKLSFGIQYDTPMDLLLLGAGIVALAGSLVITHYVAGQRKRSLKA